jgi:hypothetical protein
MYFTPQKDYKHIITKNKAIFTFFVARYGFEPQLSGPKPEVLPLDDLTMSIYQL